MQIAEYIMRYLVSLFSTNRAMWVQKTKINVDKIVQIYKKFTFRRKYTLV